MTEETRLESDLRAYYAAIPVGLPREVAAATGAAVRTQSQARQRPRWLLAVAAAITLAVVATALAIVGSSLDDRRPETTPPSASPASSSLEPSESAAAATGLPAGTIAVARRDVSMPTNLEVSTGQTVFIVAGPVDHAGVPSYLIQHFGDNDKGYRPDGDVGWIPAETAEADLAPTSLPCPADTADLSAVAALQPFARLVCFGARDLTFPSVTASDMSVGAKTSRRWISTDRRPDFFTGLPVYGLTPSLAMPDGKWFRVTGHFDAPDSGSCGDIGQVVWCRERFVVTAVEPVAAPDFVLPGAWRATKLPPIDGRTEHSMVWTGKEAVIWGGFASSPNQSVFDAATPRGGAAYDPATDRWRKVPDAPIPGRGSALMAWTGREVVVFGGWAAEVSRLDGAAWNPVTNKWRKIARSPLTGKETVGGWLADRLYVVTSTSAAAYDPEADRWTELPPAPVRVGWRTVAVAAGRLFIVAFGDGATPPVDWAVLDPATGTWTNGKAPLDPLVAGVVFKGAGDLIVVTDTGDTFDPLTATWGTGAKCEGVSAGTVWTGAWLLGVTAAWNRGSGDCLQLPPGPPREPPFDDSNGREFPVAVWTGTEYITWSGGNGGDIVWMPKDGAVFTPVLDLGPLPVP
jgi:hypothetical protein